MWHGLPSLATELAERWRALLSVAGMSRVASEEQRRQLFEQPEEMSICIPDDRSRVPTDHVPLIAETEGL